MATYHGGDGGNEDPHRPWWRKGWGCKGSGGPRKGKGRGPGQNLNLEEEFAKRGRLSIDFDTTHFKTWQAIGDNAPMYKSLIGTLIRTVPQTYDLWDHVPQERKAFVIPTLNTRFNLDHFIYTPDPLDPVRQGFRLAVEADCKAEYRVRKSQFKRKHFQSKGGLKAVPQLEQAVPPEDLSAEDWRALLRYYQREDRVKLSDTNKTNRGKQVLAGTHGRQSYSQYVHQEKVHKNRDVDLVDLYEERHKKKADGRPWEHPVAEQIHAKLKKKKEEAEREPNPTPQDQIFMEELGSRPGHRRGIGRVIRQIGTQAYDYTHLTQGQGAQPHQAHGTGQPRPDLDLNIDAAGSQSSWVEDLFNYDSYAQATLPPQPGAQSATGSHFSGGSYHVNLDDDDDEDDVDMY